MYYIKCGAFILLRKELLCSQNIKKQQNHQTTTQNLEAARIGEMTANKMTEDDS